MVRADEAFLKRLVMVEPWLEPVFAEHAADYDDEMLPHVLMASVARLIASGSTDSQQRRQLLDRLEAEFGRQDDVDGLIAVSFLELLPYQDEPGVEVTRLLGPKLAAELARQRPDEYPPADAGEDFARRLAATEPWLGTMLAKHEARNSGRLRASSFLEEAARAAAERTDDPYELRPLFARVEADLGRNAKVDALISEAFLGNLPSYGALRAELLPLLGPRTRRALKV